MVTRRRSGWSGSGCSASASAHSAAAADRMLEEIEAAETLADLAHFAMREGSAADSGRDWTRRRKRVKSQSPPPAESVTRCSDLPQDRIKSPEQSAEVCGNVMAESSKAHDQSEENLTELPKPSLIGATEPGCSLLGIGKSRRNLTEAEKEARRIRRILANRESARQTIRRRQAFCEELTKKAADLASENESLKMEMEMALKEYRMLETTNKRLKYQVAKVVKADVKEIPGSQNPACVQITSTSASPLFLCNHLPFTPLFWSPVAQSPNSVQASHIAQRAIAMPSNIPLPADGRHDSCEQENLRNTSGPRTPLYIFPCPWFFPHLDPPTLLQSQSSIFQKNEQDETSTNNQQSPTSSRTPPHLENQHSHMHSKVKTEPSSSLEARTTNDLNEHPAGVAQDEGDQQTGSHLKGSFSKEALVTPLPIKPVVFPSTIKHESGPQLDSTHHIKTSAEVCHAPPAMALREKFCEPIIYSCKRSAEAVAAAEARKRRKELTKLKNLHGRQCRMHC